MKTNKRLLLALTVLISASMACGLIGISGEETKAPTGDSSQTTPIIITATSEASATEADSETEIESTPRSDTPTATLKQDLNVRRGPGTSYAIITALPGGTTLEIIGKSSNGYWWAVLLPSGVQGWVSASYTTYTNTEDVPVISAPVTADRDAPPTEAPTGDDDTTDEGVAPPDTDLSTEINIKNGNFTLDGVVSYPSGDTIDKVHVEINGFDGIKTSGKVIYSLSCVATASPPSVTHIGGSVVAGVVGCSSSWTVFYTNDSDSSNITIQQESNGFADWVLFASAVSD